MKEDVGKMKETQREMKGHHHRHRHRHHGLIVAVVLYLVILSASLSSAQQQQVSRPPTSEGNDEAPYDYDGGGLDAAAPPRSQNRRR